ncbi:hypothetical protein V6N13_142128 [Hibiscus sabdariffa]|uniref:Uncharacterized protein n=1 Tax=Hibiscus sabdariffa TaxID=183260 RepID=A0ABR2FDA8_9ROSI
MRRIDEVVELEEGKDFFMIRIEDLGLNEQSVSAQIEGRQEVPCLEKPMESKSSSLESSQSKTQATKKKNMEEVEEEEIKAICMGKLFYDSSSLYDINVWRHIGETILSDSINKETSDMGNSQSALFEDDTNDEVHGVEKVGQNKKGNITWAFLLWKLGQKQVGLRT